MIVTANVCLILRNAIISVGVHEGPGTHDRETQGCFQFFGVLTQNVIDPNKADFWREI